MQVRCLKLIKPYTGKGVADDDDDDDEEEEDDTVVRRRALPSEGRIMETDVLSQAYHISKSDNFPHLYLDTFLFCLSSEILTEGNVLTFSFKDVLGCSHLELIVCTCTIGHCVLCTICSTIL